MEIRVVKNEDGVVTYEEVVIKTVKAADVDEWTARIEANAEQIKALEAENEQLAASVEAAKAILELAQAEAETAE
jgi:multidrug resistance efflux pump